ncbi:MAG: hypothetical protein ABIJ12_02430 [bacterium]
MPDANFYFGVGRDYNLGFGIKVPQITVNHLTAAHYWESNNEDYWAVYFHLNQIISTNNNPYLELGGAFIDWEGTTNYFYSAGISYGSGLADPLIDMRKIFPGYKGLIQHKRKLKLIPFVKFNSSDDQVGVSLSYYHDMTDNALEILEESFKRENEPLLTIPYNEIDTVKVLYNDLAIIKKNEDTVFVRGHFVGCGTGLAFVLPVFGMLGIGPWCPMEWYHPLRLTNDKPTYEHYYYTPKGEYIYFNKDEFNKKLENKEDIIFRSYPEELNENIKIRRESTNFLHDLSFGLSTLKYYK